MPKTQENEAICKDLSCTDPAGKNNRKGLCKKHYKREWDRKNSERRCKEPLCKKKVRRRGLCYKHILDKKISDEEDSSNKVYKCVYEDCIDGKIFNIKYQLCRKHYNKKMRYIINFIFLIF